MNWIKERAEGNGVTFKLFITGSYIGQFTIHLVNNAQYDETIINKPHFFVNGLFVIQSKRRQGYSELLLNKLDKITSKYKPSILYASSDVIPIQKLISMYESIGFEIINENDSINEGTFMIK